MSVVRRAGAVVAGLVLMGGPAWAQQDPCAPGPDGAVPLMCQSGAASDTPTVAIEDDSACPLPQEDGQPADQDAVAPDAQAGVVCTLTPVEAPSTDAEGFGSAESTGSEESTGSGADDELPRTGPYDRLLGLTAVGTGLVLAGAAAASAGRRRRA